MERDGPFSIEPSALMKDQEVVILSCDTVVVLSR